MISLLLAALVAAQDPASAFEARVFRAPDGRTLPYRIFVPKAHPTAKNRKFPLVLHPHGGGGRGSDNTAQVSGGNVPGISLWLRDEIQAADPSFVLAPQCPTDETWTLPTKANR